MSFPSLKNGLSPRKVRCVITLLVVAHCALLGWSASQHSPGVDEVGHLPAGISHWRYGQFDLYRENPPLIRLAAALPVVSAGPMVDWRSYRAGPVERTQWAIGQDLIAANGQRSFWLFTLARWACIPFSVLGALACYRWSSALYGSAAGLVALTLWCVSPNVIANAAMITPDAGAAACGVAAAYAFWRWLNASTWRNALVAGAMLGVVELTKTTWVILFGLWPALWIIWPKLDGRPANARTRGRQAGQLAVILLSGIYIINLGYGFEGSFRRLGEFEFASQALGGDHPDDQTGNRFAGTIVSGLRVPLPANYVQGIDVQKSDFERGKWSYLRGEQRFGGWWYYYLYAVAVKEPLGVFLLAACAISMRIRRRRQGRCDWRADAFLLAHALAVIVLVSSQTGFNRYVRYVLPAIPFVYIWVSQAAASFRSSNRKLAWVPLAAVAWTVSSSLFVYPHSMSYFNELAGGPLNGPEHLLDANIDWGQDLLYLKEWCADHPEANDIRIAYFGYVSPRHAGLSEVPPPPGVAEGYRPELPDSAIGPLPGWYAVSVNELYGYGHHGEGMPQFRYFLRFRPVATAGYSVYIYHLDLNEVDVARAQSGLSPRAGK